MRSLAVSKASQNGQVLIRFSEFYEAETTCDVVVVVRVDPTGNANEPTEQQMTMRVLESGATISSLTTRVATQFLAQLSMRVRSTRPLEEQSPQRVAVTHVYLSLLIDSFVWMWMWMWMFVILLQRQNHRVPFSRARKDSQCIVAPLRLMCQNQMIEQYLDAIYGAFRPASIAVGCTLLLVQAARCFVLTDAIMCHSQCTRSLSPTPSGTSIAAEGTGSLSRLATLSNESTLMCVRNILIRYHDECA